MLIDISIRDYSISSSSWFRSNSSWRRRRSVKVLIRLRMTRQDWHKDAKKSFKVWSCCICVFKNTLVRTPKIERKKSITLIGNQTTTSWLKDAWSATLLNSYFRKNLDLESFFHCLLGKGTLKQLHRLYFDCSPWGPLMIQSASHWSLPIKTNWK